MRFSGKTIVITGGASGIGLAAVRRFHAEGAAVVVADINASQAETVAREMGKDRCISRQVDVADWGQVKALMDFAVATFGGLDILYNNAGLGSFGATPDLSIEDWQRVINIDLTGVFYGCKAAIPLLRKRGGGAIINTASISGLAGDFGFAAYNAAKGGLINYTRTLAIDHAREGIRVNAICPGPIDTPIIAGIRNSPELSAMWVNCVPMGRWGAPEEIAAVAAFLASDDASFMTGSIVAVDGGLMAHTGQPNLLNLMPKLMAAAAASSS
jgi:meso-butanediol dehydrogenase / (S,S)-butanediol dehydrogenase / diacetyl reductase